MNNDATIETQHPEIVVGGSSALRLLRRRPRPNTEPVDALPVVFGNRKYIHLYDRLVCRVLVELACSRRGGTAGGCFSWGVPDLYHDMESLRLS